MQVNRGPANPNKPDIQRQISSFPHRWKEKSGEMGTKHWGEQWAEESLQYTMMCMYKTINTIIITLYTNENFNEKE